MSGWFGSPWPSEDYRAPVCENDADRVDPPPAGEQCVFCEEGFPPDAQGLRFPHIDADRNTLMRYAHLDCLLHNVGAA